MALDPVTDLSLEWGEDFEIGPDGGPALSSGAKQIRQRVIRRLLTNPAFKLADGTRVPAGYISDPEYGIGLRALIGQPEGDDFAARLVQQVRQGVIVDEGVDATQLPQVKVFQYPDGLVAIQIQVFLKSYDPVEFVLEMQR